MNFCPCLQSLLKKLQPKQEKSRYQGQREFEEEEFMNLPHHEEASLVDTIAAPPPKRATGPEKISYLAQATVDVANELPTYFEQKEESAENESQSLNIKLELSEVAPVESRPEKDIEQLIQEELLLTPSEAIKKVEIEQERVAQNSITFEEISQPVFCINLDPLDPHYALIHERTSKLSELFTQSGPRLEVGLPNKSGLSIYLLENQKASTFVLNYTLSCSYSYYLSVAKNDKTLAGLNPLLAESRMIESYKPNLTLNTLKFKRIGGFEARDCYYVKYQNGGKRQHWEIYLSVEGEQSPAFKTCDLFCAKSIRQTAERQLQFTEYIEVDLQVNSISSVLPKLAGELRNFLNALSEHIDRNYEQELV